MRNLRKTKKRGGFEFIKVFDCPVLKTGKKTAQSTCIKQFTNVNNFLIVKTADDGNCFYDTLSKYGQRTGLPSLNEPHLELRRILVNTLLNNIAEVAPYFVSNNNSNAVLTEDEIRDQIMELGKPNVWNSNGGDIVIQYAAQVFNVTINIYDVKDAFPNDVINRLVFRPLAAGADADAREVNMLRTNDSHYQLLWPASGPYAAVLPKGKKSASSLKRKPSLNTTKKNKNKKNNSNNSLTRNLKKIALFESSFVVSKP
jgi:hypothetical protein